MKARKHKAAPAPAPDRRWTQVAVLGGLTLVLAVLLAQHAADLNGPSYWKWPWRRIDTLRIFPPMFAAFVPALAALRIERNPRLPIALPLGLTMGSMYALMLVAMGVQDDPFSLERIAINVSVPRITGYFANALQVGDDVRAFMEAYPDRMAELIGHSKNKPPGLILFWTALVRLFGPTLGTAKLGGLLLGALGTASVPATYWLARRMGAERTAAFRASALIALAPGIVLFLPQFDQFYPAAACLLLGAWIAALEENSRLYAALFGLWLGVITFFTYNLLVLGIFVALLAVWKTRQGQARQVLELSAIALGTFLLFQLALFLATGWDPWATFRAAYANQKLILSRLPPRFQRPYPDTIPFDLTDFLLGLAWVPALLAAWYFWPRAGQLRDRTYWLAALGLAQIVGVALTGLLQVETARVWSFMFPLVAIPAGMELGRWTLRQAGIALTAQWLLITSLQQNMWFIK